MRTVPGLRAPVLPRWKTVRAEYSAISAPGVDANELMTKVRDNLRMDALPR